MIVLQEGERIIRQDDATLESEGRSLGEGALYLTNTRIMFESKEGGIPRMLTIQMIQATTLLRENRLAISYLSEDGREIHTDKYRLKGHARVEEWHDDFDAFLSSRRGGAQESGQKEILPAPDMFTDENVSQAHGDESASTVKIDLTSKTMKWQKIPSWRKFQDEHIWQGRQRMGDMTKEQWFAYKQEASILDKKLSELRIDYFEAKKRDNKKRGREIKEAMKIVDLELYGKGDVPYTSIKADTWPEN
ncbi:MAG: hypothetical protein M1503_03195 [Thaumarchaeota archaeon]|nr:hypothetical protein [Nitrososphaerota archaeon]MCL5317258.1 hypothetical protein [Nitrososphaerota archaeon]